MKKTVRTKNVEYSLNEIKNNYDKKEFRIPKYQRGYVWDSAKRGALIDSLLKHYPIGSIIIWNNNDHKYVLDGQQRTRSLLEIRKKPFKDMKLETFLDLFNERLVENEENILTRIHEELKNKTIEELYVDPYEENKKDYIRNYVGKIKTSAEIHGEDIKDIIKELKSYVAKFYIGDEFKIPSIDILESSEEDAVEIFDRLNSNGIELTRMEKLAARWSGNVLNIQDKDLLKIITNIYKLDDSEDIRDISKNTPSELIWALLTNSFNGTKFFSKMFTEVINGTVSLKHKHIDKLLWIIRVFILKYNDLELNSSSLNDSYEEDLKLGKKISDITNNDEDAIINAAHLLNQAWLKIEAKCPILLMENNNKYIFENTISANLFVSMVSQVFLKLLEDDQYEPKETLQLSLMKEVLNGSYQSSTNKVVKDTIKEMEYLKDIDIDEVNKKLKEVNNLQKDEVNSKNGFSLVAKIVITIAYSEYSSNVVNRFDYDHIFPKNYLKKKNLSRGQNSIGNCGLLDAITNRKKQDKIDYDELLTDKLVKFTKINKVKYEKLLNDVINTKEWDKFEEYLDYRFDIISKKFLENINPRAK